MVPRIQACLKVSTLDPTEVPKELATSFAPMAKLRTKAMMKPTMTIHNTSSGMWIILHWFWKKKDHLHINTSYGMWTILHLFWKKRRKNIIFITVLLGCEPFFNNSEKKKSDQFNQCFLHSCMVPLNAQLTQNYTKDLCRDCFKFWSINKLNLKKNSN